MATRKKIGYKYFVSVANLAINILLCWGTPACSKAEVTAISREYMAKIQMYDHDWFIFIDETGCSSKDHTRKFGYAERGSCC